MDDLRRKILIVDDNAEFANMAVHALGGHGFEISTAQDGWTALEKVASEHPAVLLLDLKLPDMSGMEVLKKIREMNEDTAVIIITGFGGEQVAVEIMKAGASDFLSKPVTHQVLLSTIQNAVKLRDARAEDRTLQRYSPLEEFFPFFAHEVRNPLHAIGGALAIIERRCDRKDEILDQSITIIQEEIQHLSGFVQECLDFVRPPMRNRYSQINLNEVVSIVIRMIGHMFEDLSRKIKIRVDLDPHLPTIEANYEEIKQAFLNVVKNSFEAMAEGGELFVTSRLKGESNSGWVEMVFRDTGIGMEAENKKHLFAPFFTTKLRGTGLGLAICQRVIVERHKGKISIESEKGKGTAVRVELPLIPLLETDKG